MAEWNFHALFIKIYGTLMDTNWDWFWGRAKKKTSGADVGLFIKYFCTWGFYGIIECPFE